MSRSTGPFMLVRLPVPRPILIHKDTVVLIWHSFDSPIGPLSLGATDRGLARVAFASDDPPAPSTATGATSEVLGAACSWLEAYFDGAILPVTFPLDLNDDTFTQRAQWALATIPAGETRSYLWLAAAAGSPNAVRAAGTACATNPLPLVLPCHRVVRADGTMGNYRGGHEAKAWLLTHERNLSPSGGV